MDKIYPKIIIIASGKGGVGKSTVALNLAVLMAQKHRVALIDSDIYGPSITTMLGSKEEVKITESDNRFLPLQKFGLKYISMGSFVPQNSAIVWRGPMLSKMLNKFFLSTDWGDIEYLIVDTPPGTGDVHITISKTFKIFGVVLVTTAQVVSLNEVARAHDMFNKLDVRVLGIVENMSYSVSEIGETKYIMGQQSNVKLFANKNNLSVIARIPFLSQISHSSDAGVPAVLDPKISLLYERIEKFLIDAV